MIAGLCKTVKFALGFVIETSAPVSVDLDMAAGVTIGQLWCPLDFRIHVGCNGNFLAVHGRERQSGVHRQNGTCICFQSPVTLLSTAYGFRHAFQAAFE